MLNHSPANIESTSLGAGTESIQNHVETQNNTNFGHGFKDIVPQFQFQCLSHSFKFISMIKFHANKRTTTKLEQLKHSKKSTEHKIRCHEYNTIRRLNHK